MKYKKCKYTKIAFNRSLDSYQEELQTQEVLDYSKFCVAKQHYDKPKKSNLDLVHNVTILGDGNCLFRCISHIIYGDQKHHALIRKKMLDYARENYIEFQSSPNLDSSLDKWIGRMSNCGNSEFGIGGEFGDSFAVELLSWMLERPIAIQIQDNKTSTIDITGAWFEAPTINLRLSNMHYTLIL